MAKVLFIIAPEGYQQQEYGDPKAVLEAAGHTVVTTSTVELALGSRGAETKVDLLLDEVDPSDYDAVAFIGGPGSVVYYEDERAHQIARAFYDAGKLTCAICAAPGTLAHAGLLNGKKATCWPNRAPIIEGLGAIYTGELVTVDGLLITGNGPEAAKAFGEKILENL